MPTTQKSIVIGIKNANFNKGEYVKVTNYTAGGTIKAQVSSSGEVAINSANSDLTWSNGDSIMVESNGRIVFAAAKTIAAGGAKITETGSTADDSPAVSL